MADDIVTRLREQNKEWLSEGDLYEKNWQLWNEAADEIERLRKLTGRLAEMLMPYALLMTKQEQLEVMKAVRGD